MLCSCNSLIRRPLGLGVFAVALAFTLPLVACGDDDDGANTAGDTGSTTSETDGASISTDGETEGGGTNTAGDDDDDDSTAIACRNNKDCPESAPLCDALKCVQCIDDTDCAEGQVCNSGKCEAKPVACEKNSNCELGFVCIDKLCTPGCNRDVDCPTTAPVCAPDEGENGTCKPQPTTSCETARDCNDGEVCENNVCTTPGSDTDGGTDTAGTDTTGGTDTAGTDTSGTDTTGGTTDTTTGGTTDTTTGGTDTGTDGGQCLPDANRTQCERSDIPCTQSNFTQVCPQGYICPSSKNYCVSAHCACAGQGCNSDQSCNQCLGTCEDKQIACTSTNDCINAGKLGQTCQNGFCAD